MSTYRVPLFKPFVNHSAIRNVMRVLSGTQIAEGPEVKAFEEEFAKKFGFEPWQIVSVNSGTSALELAYLIAGIGPGDEVIAPVLTCTATNLPLKRLGAKIVFADVEGTYTLNPDINDIRRKITDRTKAIVFVQFGGNSAGVAELQRLSEETGIPVIYDAAQAVGGLLQDPARFVVVSLQAIKSLTAGDGGILICGRRDEAARARRLRWFGYDREEKQRLGDTDLVEAGFKYHMNDISAAIARGNLEEIDTVIQHRRRINEVYRERYYEHSVAGGIGPVLIEGIWNPQVIASEAVYKEKFEAIGVQIGSYHYPNYKYSVFSDAQAVCPRMRTLEGMYFLLPCHMGVSVEQAEEISRVLWL